MAVTFIDVQLAAGAQAFQLFDSWAGALSRGRLRALRAAAHPPRVRRARRAPPGRARHPLRDRLRPPAGGDVGGRAAGDRPRLAHVDRRRPPPPRRRRRRAGQPRPGARARRRRRRPRRRPRRARRQRRPPGARLQPRPRRAPGVRPRRAGGDRRPRPRDDRADDHRRRADGVRHAAGAGGDRGRTTPTSAVAGRRRAEQLADLTRRYEAIGGISPLAAITEAQRDALQAALDERAPGRVRRRRSASSTPTRRSRTAWRRSPPPASSGSSGSCWRRTTRRCRSASTSAGPAPPPTTAGVPFAGVESWATEPAYVDFLAGEVRRRSTACRRTRRCCSPPTRCRRAILDAGDPYPDELRATAAAVAGAVGLAPWAQWSVGWQSAGPHARAVDRPRRPRRHRRAGGRRRTPTGCSCARAGSSPTTSRCSTTSTSRPAGGPSDRGLAFGRTASMNDDPAVIGALADRVVAASMTAGPRRRWRHQRAGRRLRRSPGSSTATTWRSSCARPTTASAASCARRRSPGCPAVDEGADAFLARVPDATDARPRSGSAIDLTSPTDATAAVWYDGLHPIPEGLLLGVPTDIAAPGDAAGLLSLRGQAPRRGSSRCSPAAATPTTRSARSSAAASATRSTSGSSTRSSAASTPPTPTASAWRWSRSWPRSPDAAAACCSAPGRCARRRRPRTGRCSTPRGGHGGARRRRGRRGRRARA